MKKSMFVVRVIMIVVAIGFAVMVGVAIGSGGAVRVLTLLMSTAIAVTVACVVTTNTIFILASRRTAEAARDAARMAEEAKRLTARAKVLEIMLNQPGEVFQNDVYNSPHHGNAPYSHADIRCALSDLLGAEMVTRRISETGGAWWSATDREQAELSLHEMRDRVCVLVAQGIDLKIDNMADAGFLKSQAGRLQESLGALGLEDAS